MMQSCDENRRKRLLLPETGGKGKIATDVQERLHKTADGRPGYEFNSNPRNLREGVFKTQPEPYPEYGTASVRKTAEMPEMRRTYPAATDLKLKTQFYEPQQPDQRRAPIIESYPTTKWL